MTSEVVGKGSYDQPLNDREIHDICAEALATLNVDGKRVLVLIPDHTRHAPIPTFFRIIAELLHPRVKQLEFMVATGTHAAMTDEHLYTHVGLTAAEHREKFPRVVFSNHDHRNLQSLVSLGKVPGHEISGLTQGLFSQDLPVTINRKAVECDQIIVVSPVVPHEAMGFAGGNKYFFPGIAGLDVVETFHWLAAMITNPVVNGVKDTPTRRVIDRAVEFLQTPRMCLAFAVDEKHRLACLFAGETREAWSRAADYSAKLHIRYLDKPVRRVLGLTPRIYEDLWVAGKAMYKLEPVVADGGELVIHGPHVRSISFMHDREIRRIGYHVRDYFVKQWDRFAGEPKLILAHSTNVRGIGTFDNGKEHPRIHVTLATSISRDDCQSVNLGHRDYAAIDSRRWAENNETLVVEEAGQVLYRLKNS